MKNRTEIYCRLKRNGFSGYSGAQQKLFGREIYNVQLRERTGPLLTTTLSRLQPTINLQNLDQRK
jgi:hypothetical protein